jgi:hypothetical protein
LSGKLSVGFGQQPYTLQASPGKFGVHTGLGAKLQSTATSSPLTLPLVTTQTQINSIFTYLGSFDVPADFNYGGVGMAASGTSLYCSGIQNDGTGFSVGLMTPPTKAQIIAGGHSATTVVVPKNTTAEVGQSASTSFTSNCGSILYGGSLYSNVGIFYNGALAQTSLFLKSPANLSAVGTTPSPISGQGSGTLVSQFTGQLMNVPSIWQSTLGGPVMCATGPGLGIIESLCVGNGFYVFDPANINGSGSTCPITPLVNYPHVADQGANQAVDTTALWNRTNVIGSISGSSLTVSSIKIAGTVINTGATIYWAGNVTGVTITGRGTGTGGVGTYTLSGSFTVSAGTSFWISNISTNPSNGANTGGDDLLSTYDGTIGCAFIVPGSRTLAQIYVHHYGPELGAQSNLACDSSASGNNDPRRVQINLYDLAQIVGASSISAITPYAWFEFPNWLTIIGSCPATSPGSGWMAYDDVNGIMYGNPQGFSGGGVPLYAWSITGI